MFSGIIGQEDEMLCPLLNESTGGGLELKHSQSHKNELHLLVESRIY
jgi:hypothetical protein